MIILGLSEEAGFLPVGHFELERVRDQFVEGIGDGGGQGVRLTSPPAYGLRRDVIDDNDVLVIRRAARHGGVEVFESGEAVEAARG